MLTADWLDVIVEMEMYASLGLGDAREIRNSFFVYTGLKNVAPSVISLSDRSIQWVSSDNI